MVGLQWCTGHLFDLRLLPLERWLLRFVKQLVVSHILVKLVANVLKQRALLPRLWSDLVTLLDDEAIADGVEVDKLFELMPDLLRRLVGRDDEDTVVERDRAAFHLSSAGILVGPHLESVCQAFEGEDFVEIFDDDHRLVSVAIEPFVLGLNIGHPTELLPGELESPMSLACVGWSPQP